MVEQLEQFKIEWFRNQLKSWADQNFRDFPWRRTSEPYAIFVAEFLLQKTGAATATPVYEAAGFRGDSLHGEESSLY